MEYSEKFRRILWFFAYWVALLVGSFFVVFFVRFLVDGFNIHRIATYSEGRLEGAVFILIGTFIVACVLMNRKK